MSNSHLLHFLVGGEDRPLPWPMDLTSLHIVLLRARNAGEARALVRAYPMMMMIADVDRWDEQAQPAIEEMRQISTNGSRPAMIAMLRFEPDRELRRTLERIGVDGVILHDDPERFIRWQIEMLAQLHALAAFEQARMDVSVLASQTRQKLHDLSQPLSAIQGRLQLMAAKADRDDPNSQCLHELVRLTFSVSHQVMEIQRIHRSYS